MIMVVVVVLPRTRNVISVNLELKSRLFLHVRVPYRLAGPGLNRRYSIDGEQLIDQSESQRQ